MSSVCAAPGAADPLVRGLLGVVDCNTESLVHGGYVALFQPSSPFAVVLTTILTLYVGFIGYRLMVGQSQLRVTDFALTAVKIGAVIALATQWDAYQTLVYRFLFDGPQQLASTMLSSVQPENSAFRGNVFDGLQRAFDDLSTFAGGFASKSTPQTSPLLGGAGFGALMLTSSATILLLSSLGVLLAAKIVLGLLLAVGPVFIALALFDTTRGLFEGWLRASVAFAFAPFASILLLAVTLTMLEPSLLQMEELKKKGVFVLEPVYSVATLILVFAGVSAGAIIAGGMVAQGFKLPRRAETPAPASLPNATAGASPAEPYRSRAARVAAAAASLARRDEIVFAREALSSSAVFDRRTEIVASPADRRLGGNASADVRLGQKSRAGERRRTPRPTARIA